MQLIDRSILLGQDSMAIAAHAYAIAPWLKPPVNPAGRAGEIHILKPDERPWWPK